MQNASNDFQVRQTDVLSTVEQSKSSKTFFEKLYKLIPNYLCSFAFLICFAF